MHPLVESDFSNGCVDGGHTGQRVCMAGPVSIATAIGVSMVPLGSVTIDRAVDMTRVDIKANLTAILTRPILGTHKYLKLRYFARRWNSMPLCRRTGIYRHRTSLVPLVAAGFHGVTRAGPRCPECKSRRAPGGQNLAPGKCGSHPGSGNPLPGLAKRSEPPFSAPAASEMMQFDNSSEIMAKMCK